MLSKEGNPSNSLQILPGCRPYILTGTDTLLVPPSHSVTGSFSSTHTLFSDFMSRSLHLCAVFFSLSFFLFPQTLVLFPPLSLLSHPSCLPRLHIKADDWFQTVKQAVFSPALCEETNIISINMGKNLLLW